MDKLPAIGNRVYQVRYLAGLGSEGDQAKFAQELSISPKRYSHWEVGRSLIPVLYALKLVDYTPGLTLDYIYRGGFDFVTPELGRRLRKVPERPVSKRGRKPKAGRKPKL